MTDDIKICSGCRRILDAESFPTRSKQYVQDGLSAQCFECLAKGKPIIQSRRHGSGENVSNGIEGHFVAKLVYVFKQLEDSGVRCHERC